MWQRLSLYDMRVIGHYLGDLILIAAVGLVPSFVVAIIFKEWEPASRYLLAIGIFLTAGSSLRFLRIQPGRLSRQQALAVTGLAWMVLALFASIPLAMSGHSAKETIHTENQRFLKYGFNGSGIAASIRAANSSTGIFSPSRNQSLMASDKARM